MKALVIYTSHYGNTKAIAEAIGEGLRAFGIARVAPVEDASGLLSEKFDLLLIGGPTEQRDMTEPMARFFDRLERDTLRGTAVAVFDTRLQWPRWMSGSAAARIDERLRKAGARVVTPDESFFVKAGGASDRHPPVLEDGELDRARAWATSVARTVMAGATTGAGQA